MFGTLISPKVRVFLRRASKDYIPTTQNLKMHHMPISGCNVSRRVASTAVVLRNYNGEVLGASADIIRWSGSVVVAELETIRFGMNFCLTHGFSSICIFFRFPYCGSGY